MGNVSQISPMCRNFKQKCKTFPAQLAHVQEDYKEASNCSYTWQKYGRNISYTFSFLPALFEILPTLFAILPIYTFLHFLPAHYWSMLPALLHVQEVFLALYGTRPSQPCLPVFSRAISRTQSICLKSCVRVWFASSCLCGPFDFYNSSHLLGLQRTCQRWNWGKSCCGCWYCDCFQCNPGIL